MHHYLGIELADVENGRIRVHSTDLETWGRNQIEVRSTSRKVGTWTEISKIVEYLLGGLGQGETGGDGSAALRGEKTSGSGSSVRYILRLAVG